MNADTPRPLVPCTRFFGRMALLQVVGLLLGLYDGVPPGQFITHDPDIVAEILVDFLGGA